ncbi:MAG: DegV family protein [Anaerolineales bacterium]
MHIITDRAANLTLEEERSLGLTVAPLYIQFPGEEVETSTIHPDDFYHRLLEMKPRIPSTAQPSSGLFQEMYQKIIDSGENVLSIHLSSGLSGTIQSARSAAQEIRESAVTIFDSMTLSGGQRFQVMGAALAAKAGWALEETLDFLHKLREEIEVVYTLDTLEYLEHGGRIGRVQSLVSSLLHIKPIIHVDRKDGMYSTIGKERTLSRSVAAMVDHLENMYAGRPLWVTVLHGQLEEEASELIEKLKDKLDIHRSELLRVTPVLGVHTGPGIVGVSAVPIDLFSRLL